MDNPELLLGDHLSEEEFRSDYYNLLAECEYADCLKQHPKKESSEELELFFAELEVSLNNTKKLLQEIKQNKEN